VRNGTPFSHTGGLVALLMAFSGATAAVAATTPGHARIFRTGMVNGDFGGGDLQGFRADEVGGGSVAVIREGDVRSTHAALESARFPEGPGSYAVALRVPAGLPDALALVTSLPFIPAAADLSVALTGAGTGRLELLFLEPEADLVAPEPADIQHRVELPIESATAGAFTTTSVPLPHGTARPVRIQFRLSPSNAAGEAFVLLTSIQAGTISGVTDRDLDGVTDVIDNCVTLPNRDQRNTDGDRFGDVCDNCPHTPNNDQGDRDGDGIGSRCDVDITSDGFVDASDLAALAAAFGHARDAPSARDPRLDLDDSGMIDLLDLALFARAVRIGIATDDLQDFTYAFTNDSVHGGIGLRIRPGMVMSAIPGSDLIVFPGPRALMIRSGTKGSPAAEGVMTSLPFVPRGPRLSVQSLSESPNVVATLRVLRSLTRPGVAPTEQVLIEVPLRTDRAATGPSARFDTQTIDLSRWFDASQPLRNLPIQIQLRQHTQNPGAGYFTLIGDLRTLP
jgi:hypothetical protein